MENDALDAGIRPGGLRSKQDIKILICYILEKCAARLSRQSLERALINSQLVNYFEASDCLSDLIKLHNIELDGEICLLTDSGREIAQRLEDDLPPSVRQRAVATTLELCETERRLRENKVEKSNSGSGCEVRCRVLGDKTDDLLSIVLNVADRDQAKVIEKNFLKRPELIYSTVIALLTGNQDFAKDALKAMEEPQQ